MFYLFHFLKQDKENVMDFYFDALSCFNFAFRYHKQNTYKLAFICLQICTYHHLKKGWGFLFNSYVATNSRRYQWHIGFSGTLGCLANRITIYTAPGHHFVLSILISLVHSFYLQEVCRRSQSVLSSIPQSHLKMEIQHTKISHLL